MVRVIHKPNVPMTSTPAESVLTTDWDDLQKDAIPLRDAVESLLGNTQLDAERQGGREKKSLAAKGMAKGKKAWDKVYGNMSVAEVVRQMKKG